jgi:molybdenum cofactor cytidylyltransferase
LIGAIVLAGGASTRYGHESKLLALLAGRTVIARSVAALDEQPIRPVVVVTGRERQRVRRAVRAQVTGHRRYRWVHNANYRSGMAESLRCGLAALPTCCDAALIMLGDMPGIDKRTISRLCRLWRPGLDYVRPVCGGRPGHPVIVSRRLFADLARLDGDRGAKAILDQVPATRFRVVDAPAGCLRDVDTPAAARRIERSFNRGHSQNQTGTISSSFMV